MARIYKGGGEFDPSDLGFDPHETSERSGYNAKRNRGKAAKKKGRNSGVTKPKSAAALKGKQSQPDIRTIHRVVTGDQAGLVVKAAFDAEAKTDVAGFEHRLDDDTNMRLEVLSEGMSRRIFQRFYLPRYHDTEVSTRVFNEVAQRASSRLTLPSMDISLGKVDTHKVVDPVSLDIFEGVHFEIEDLAAREALVADNLVVQNEFQADSRNTVDPSPYAVRLVIGLAQSVSEATAMADELDSMSGTNLVLGPSRTDSTPIA